MIKKATAMEIVAVFVCPELMSRWEGLAREPPKVLDHSISSGSTALRDKCEVEGEIKWH